MERVAIVRRIRVYGIYRVGTIGLQNREYNWE